MEDWWGHNDFIPWGLCWVFSPLKVPLVVFKREKEIARSLEFDGMWVAEQPSEDDIRGMWDKLVISTRSFPDKYWDKFVKKKVRIQVAACGGLVTLDSMICGCPHRSATSTLSSMITIKSAICWEWRKLMDSMLRQVPSRKSPPFCPHGELTLSTPGPPCLLSLFLNSVQNLQDYRDWLAVPILEVWYHPDW